MTEDSGSGREAEERRAAAFKRAGFAVGIGSAAIVAALLYASRPKKAAPPRTSEDQAISTD